MKCDTCEQKAVFLSPNLCKEHFCAYLEKKVLNTINEFELIAKEHKVCVAVSGGKDSLTLLHILIKLGYNVEGLLINEGIQGYREHTIKDAENFCKKHHITLRVVSFKKEIGKELDEIMKNHTHPCKICGTFRRYLLNSFAKEYDVIATGHNADDEAQAILMNMLKANTNFIPRLGPKTNALIKNKRFTQRVKPLYFCTEKEIMTYAIINNIKSKFTECPYITDSFRNKVRDALNELTKNDPNIKINILNHYIQEQKLFEVNIKQEVSACTICGEAAQEEICKTCRLKKEVLT